MQNKENCIQKKCKIFNHNIVFENCPSIKLTQPLRPFFSSRFQVIKNYVYYNDPIILKEEDSLKY